MWPSMTELHSLPYFWGELSLEDSKTLLLSKQKGSFILRQSKKNVIVISQLDDSLGLVDQEITQCNCIFQDICRVSSIDQFVNRAKIFRGPNIYVHPVMRKNTFSLKVLATAAVKDYAQTPDIIDKLDISPLEKKEIEHFVPFFDLRPLPHNHFLINIDEKEPTKVWYDQNYIRVMFNSETMDGHFVIKLISLSKKHGT